MNARKWFQANEWTCPLSAVWRKPLDERIILAPWAFAGGEPPMFPSRCEGAGSKGAKLRSFGAEGDHAEHLVWTSSLSRCGNKSQVSAPAGSKTQAWLTACHLVVLKTTASDHLIPGSQAGVSSRGTQQVTQGDSWGRAQEETEGWP